MKNNFIFIFLLIILFSTSIIAQIPTSPTPFNQSLRPEESLAIIANDLQEIAKSVKELNKSIVDTYGRVLSTKGLSLTESQQKLLVSFEILNRAETRLANLQKLRIELIEKKTSVLSQLGQVEDELRDESIDRSIAIRGTTNAEELREKRRNTLNRQQNSLRTLLQEIETTFAETDGELAQTVMLVRDLRSKLFPAIYRELPKLDNKYIY